MGPISYCDQSTKCAVEKMVQNQADDDVLAKRDVQCGNAIHVFHQDFFEHIATNQMPRAKLNSFSRRQGLSHYTFRSIECSWSECRQSAWRQ